MVPTTATASIDLALPSLGASCRNKNGGPFGPPLMRM
jgi:hypothetical protein